MELYHRIIDLIDANLIFCLIPIILTLVAAEVFFKNRFETQKALQLICWIIISYTLVTFAFYLVSMFINPEEHAFVTRATGPYAWAYWIMLLGALILPFTLFIKKLARKFLYVLVVAFAMKSGMYFERFVILVTSYHRDAITENEANSLLDSFTYNIGVLSLQGFLIAITLLGIFEIVKLKYK